VIGYLRVPAVSELYRKDAPGDRAERQAAIACAIPEKLDQFFTLLSPFPMYEG
jgi:hypothetical protein